MFKKSKEKQIEISITDSMMNEAFKNFQINNIKNVAVNFSENSLSIMGKVGKAGLIPFKIKFRLINCEERKIFFDKVKIEPIDVKIIKYLILNKSTFMEYKDNKLSINLNKFDMIKKFPNGEIKNIDIQNGIMHVCIGA